MAFLMSGNAHDNDEDVSPQAQREFVGAVSLVEDRKQERAVDEHVRH